MFEQPVVFDASTLLNILATGEAPAILRCVPVPRIVSSVAASEVLHLRNQDSAKAPDSVSLEPLVDAGLLTLATPQTRLEELLYVQFAASLDDGEASSLALCVAHSYAFATDDRKARRIAREQLTPVPLVATSDLILNWMKETSASSDKVRSALIAIAIRARFTPWKGYPGQLWWESML